MIIPKKVVLKFSAFAALILMIIFSSSVSSYAQHKKYKESDMPKAVIESFNKLYPNVTVKGYDIETEDGKTFYEVESKDGSVSRDVLFSETGSLVSVEESMNVSDLSSDIVNTINSKYPKYKISKAEKITKGSDVSYEVLIKSNKKKVELVLNSKGEILETE